MFCVSGVSVGTWMLSCGIVQITRRYGTVDDDDQMVGQGVLVLGLILVILEGQGTDQDMKNQAMGDQMVGQVVLVILEVQGTGQEMRNQVMGDQMVGQAVLEVQVMENLDTFLVKMETRLHIFQTSPLVQDNRGITLGSLTIILAVVLMKM